MKLGLSLSNIELPGGRPAPRFDDLREMAQLAEQLGFDSIWLADHLIHRPPGGEERGFWEAFTFLGALAAVTSRIALGPLVACSSFRNPALLAKMAGSIDEISRGRFILGLGAGWEAWEYRAFGYPFDHRVARFEEALQIIVPLLREGRVDFAGRYHEARDAVLRPRGPRPAGPPIWIGGGRPRMLELTARYADAWNCSAKEGRADLIAARYQDMVRACERVGRDPATLELTAQVEACVLDPGQRRSRDDPAMTGTAEEVAEMLHACREVGVGHLAVLVLPNDVRGFERFGRVRELLHSTWGATGESGRVPTPDRRRAADGPATRPA
ncbi:MAG: LLM class flavin-dependent oxidoreductase [Chloroflexi bacterium]|nr:LLM class flavin-dependent oxidoreductase [Chloroflexota bacterium]